MTVFRNPDDAFPVYLKGMDVSVKATADVLETVKAQASADYASRVSGLLVRLDDLSGDLGMQFRTAYGVFHADPYRGYPVFVRQVELMLDQLRKLREIRTRSEALANLLANLPQGTFQIGVQLTELETLMGLRLAEQSVQRIAEARTDVTAMLEVNEDE